MSGAIQHIFLCISSNYTEEQKNYGTCNNFSSALNQQEARIYARKDIK